MVKKKIEFEKLVKLIEENRDLLKNIYKYGFDVDADWSFDEGIIYVYVMTDWKRPPKKVMDKIREIFKADGVSFLGDDGMQPFLTISYDRKR